MKKSFMNNIKHFVDSNVRQRIDRAANNNNDFFGDDLLLVERQFEDMRNVCAEAEKRISALLQSLASSPLGNYTQNVQASLNNLSTNLTVTNSQASQNCSSSSSNNNVINSNTKQTQKKPADETQSSNNYNKSCQSSRLNTCTVQVNNESSTITSTLSSVSPACSNKHSNIQFQISSGSAKDTTVLREDIRRHKKLPIVGFLKFLVKSCHKLRPDSLLATTLIHCSDLQSNLTDLYLNYEQTIELQCLKPLQNILENDIPTVMKLRKLFIKSHNDLESVKAKYNGASQKQQQILTNHSTSTSYTIVQNSVQQTNINKLDQLKKELDDAISKFEQARDTYATELYAFVCRETEMVNLFMKFYRYQADYQSKVGEAIKDSLPSLSNLMASTPRKVVFGTCIEEHIRCTGRPLSLVIELCVHILNSKALNEEGLFRIPGSSIKIKKLKNAINAWFVTLARQIDLDSNQPASHASVLAVHDLFKEIVGQRPQQIQTDIDANQSNLSTREDMTPASISYAQVDIQRDFVFDVHTIAGLLKLYLRELPEPLFTNALYQKFLDATTLAVEDNQIHELELVIQQLPKVNFDNLRYLIRFLHLLTCHRESNKMTATNLAITMAPSLIWACPLDDSRKPLEGHSLVCEQTPEDAQSINQQMSSIGMSASMHALVIENLINNAERLFSGPIQFVVAGLDEIPVELCNKTRQLSHHDRCVDSGSPTGLSTASSSSYSSTSNTSLTTSGKNHSRKGGSMDGLLSDIEKNARSNRPPPEQARPYSVMMGKSSMSHGQPPPPVPPAPATRSHMKHSIESNPTHRPTISHKSAAPPVPPPITSKRHQYNLNDAANLVVNKSRTFNSLVQSALASHTSRSLGSTTSTSPSIANVPSTTRPTVPPPSRPLATNPNSLDNVSPSENQTLLAKRDDNKSPYSLEKSGNFEDINVDDTSVPSVSPIVSLDGTISGDDSSFDNDSRSLEHSWADCELVERGNSTENLSIKTGLEPELENQIPKVNFEQSNEKEQEETTEVIQGGDNPTPPPPVKPPRSISPKITQSTPL